MNQKFGGFKPGKPKVIPIHAEFFSEGERVNFRDVKHYRRRKRWLT